MDEQLTVAGKRLARWCYSRGVDERLLAAVSSCAEWPSARHSADRRRRISSRRCGDRPPRCCASDATGTATTGEPTDAGSVPALRRGGRPVPTHSGGRCRACGGQLHRICVDEGFDTHPSCDRPGVNGSLAFLEHTAQLPGATLLAQPA